MKLIVWKKKCDASNFVIIAQGTLQNANAFKICCAWLPSESGQG
jgi:hypothetical protein